MNRRERSLYYVLEGHEPRPEPDPMKWAASLERLDERRVAFTTLLDGSDVSTVFLGLDHAWGGGRPMLFETCVFLHENTEPGSESPFTSGRRLQTSEVQQRYSTWAEAEIGHMELCEQLTAALAAWQAKGST